MVAYVYLGNLKFLNWKSHFRGATELNHRARPHLLWHSLLRRDRERQEDQVRGPAESHRRHHGTPHWVFDHKWCRDFVFSSQVCHRMDPGQNWSPCWPQENGADCPTSQCWKPLIWNPMRDWCLLQNLNLKKYKVNFHFLMLFLLFWNRLSTLSSHHKCKWKY